MSAVALGRVSSSAATGDRPRRVASSRYAAFAAAGLPFLLVGALTFANSSDDPLVTLRYAYNLLHHGQPVFNLGQRVEGYTSPLHLLLAVVLLVLPGGAALIKLKLASLLFAAGALWQTGRLSRIVGLPRSAQLAVMVAVAGSWNFMVSAGNGLETSLVAFLATGAASSLAEPDQARVPRRAAAWSGLLALSRPDAVLIVAALAGVSLMREHGQTWWRRITWLIGPAAALGALLAFRLAYYGELVPNTYFAKHLGVLPSAALGSLYLVGSQPLSGLGLGAVVLILEGWLIWEGTRRHARARPAITYALGVTLAEVLFVVTSGGDWMKGERFLAPAIPAATVLVFLGVEAVLASGPRGRATSPAGRRLALTAITAALVAPVTGADVAPAWSLGGVSDRSLIASGHYPLSPIWTKAVGLARCLKAGQSVAYSEAGLLGYEYPDLRVIDTRGLTDTEIALRSPASEHRPWGVVDNQWFRPSSTVGTALIVSRPEMIISFDNSAAVLPHTWILGGRYRRAAVFPEPGSNAILLVYLRRGFACSSAAGSNV